MHNLKKFPDGKLLKYLSFTGFSIILLVLLLPSCEYKLKSENFNDISKPDTSKRIQLTLIPADTFYLFTLPTDINYNLNTFGLKIYNVEIFVDGQSVYKGDQQKAVFSFNPSYFSPGYKTMSLVVTTNTNTRSLADLTGYEGLVFKKEWQIYVDGDGPGTVNFTHIFNDDGLLKLEWDPYLRPNFQKYRIWVHYTPDSYPDNDYLIGEISDPHRNWWYDSSFVGGTPRYWVEVMASNQYGPSEVKHFDYEYPKLQVIWQQGDSALFGWSKHAFYRALDSYIITTKDIYPYNQKVIFSSANPKDTSFLLRNAPFGAPVDYTLIQKAKKSIIPRLGINAVSTKINLGLGNLFPKFTGIKEVYGKPVLYLTSGTGSKISFPSGNQLFTFNVTDGGNWNVSPDDDLIFTWSGNTIVKRDPQSLAQLQTYPLFYPGIPSGHDISIKGTGIKWMVDGSFGLYDFINGTYIFTGKNAGLNGVNLSPDGNYTYTIQNSSIIVNEVTSNGLVEKWQLTGSHYSAIKWLQEDYSKLLVMSVDPLVVPYQNTMTVYDPATKTILYKANVINGNFAGVDPESGKLLLWDQTPGMDDKYKAYLYDYKTGLLKHEFYLAPRFDNLLIYRSNLISGEGLRLDISNY